MDLTAKTQNRRGGTPQHKENLGYVNTFIDADNYILVDNYEGFGDTYKKSKETNVQIVIKGQHLFNGNLNELETKLK